MAALHLSPSGKLCEDKGAYTVSTSMESLSPYPTPQYRITLSFNTDPDRAGGTKYHRQRNRAVLQNQGIDEEILQK